MKTIKNMTADQLRKSILQLAIQGKLVKQDPKDEPASVLVEKIYEEKKKLIAEGKIKKEKVESRIFKGDDNRYYEKIGKETKDITDELPFEIPESWEWIRLENLSFLNGGYAFKSNMFSQKGIRIIRISDFDENGINNKEIKRYPYSKELDQYKIINNDILLCMTGGTVGKCAIVNSLVEDSYINQRIALIRFHSININYGYLVLKSAYVSNLIKSSKTSTNDNISMKLIENILLPLPPLSEQQRIMKRIEQIEPLLQQYDKLEKQLTKLENEITDKLKKSILQYAIEGKLVKQDPNDEPASVLLERIKAEKQKLIKEGKIKRDKNESYIYQGDDKNYYENPVFIKPYNWHFCKLINISNYIHRGKSPKYGQSDLPIIAQKCNQWKGIEIEKCLYADEKTKNLYTVEQFININDIIVNSTGTGTVGRVNIITSDIFNKYDNFVTDSHITLIKLNSLINCKFVYYFLKSPEIQSDIESKCTGSTNQIELGTDTIKNFYICLPPLAEQQRIVNKIERLFNVL